jgi:hypothetical protein
MKKNFKILLIVLIVLVLVVVILFLSKKYNPEKVMAPDKPLPQVLGEQEDFLGFSIIPRSEVSGKIEALGEIQGNYFFEGNVGITIIDASGKELRRTYGIATSDWMTTGPVTFMTSLDFTDLPAGPSYIKIIQEDPSGGESGKVPKQILIPVIIK